MILKLSAKAVSYLFHPLWLPTLALFMVIWALPEHFHDIGSKGVGRVFIVLFLNTFFFPVFVVLMLKKLKFLKSIQLEGQRERIFPYITTSFFYTWAFLVFKDYEFASEVAISPLGAGLLRVIVMGAMLAVYAGFFLNILLKVSMHAIGMGCLFAISFLMLILSSYNLIIPFMGVILVVGIVGSARMKLGAHTPPEIYGGYLAGILSLLIAIQTL